MSKLEYLLFLHSNFEITKIWFKYLFLNFMIKKKYQLTLFYLSFQICSKMCLTEIKLDNDNLIEIVLLFNLQVFHPFAANFTVCSP